MEMNTKSYWPDIARGLKFLGVAEALDVKLESKIDLAGPAKKDLT